MSALPRCTIAALAAAVLLLLGLNLWMAPRLALKSSATSFGVERRGYKAAYDLLLESGVPVRRSYVAPSATPAHGSLWFVAPAFLDSLQRENAAAAGAVLRWIRAGGTAVVFGGPASDWKRLGITRGISVSSGGQQVKGDFAPLTRRLDVLELMHFASGHDQARVRLTCLTCGGAPFALEMPLGVGRLIAVADGRFLLNANLGSEDTSVLLADFVRALGPPVFDEYFHGLVESDSLVATLAGSRVILPLAAGLLLALLWVGEQRSWPPRRLAGRGEEPAPSIASFLDSLGMLYARARDPAAAFLVYRTGFLRRTRRQLWPHGEFSEQLLLERLAHHRALPAETRRWLIDGAVPATEGELVSAVRAIESCPGVN
jgi:hypothetical protein